MKKVKRNLTMRFKEPLIDHVEGEMIDKSELLEYIVKHPLAIVFFLKVTHHQN
jgi:hypothetical protein